jgi:nucleotide-binding universal stress UspA family protein
MTASVLVGIDDSEAAKLAVGWAADDADRRRRPLRIVHVHQPWCPPGPSGEELLAIAADAVWKEHPDLEIETRLIGDGVVESLLEQSVDTFEVVFGHSGRGGSSRTLGAIGQWAGGKSAQPVIVTCGDTTSARGHVVVGIDPFHEATDLLEYAFDMARMRQATLWICHAWKLPGRLLRSEHVSLLEGAEEDGPSQALFGLISDSWRERHPDLKVVERTICAAPAPAMVEASAQADLIIVGTRDRRGSEGHVIAVRRALLEQSRCPVAVVPTTTGEDRSLH